VDFCYVLNVSGRMIIGRLDVNVALGFVGAACVSGRRI